MGIATGVGTTTAAAAIAGGIAWAAEVGTDIAAGGTGGNGTVGVPVMTGDAPASGVAGTVAGTVAVGRKSFAAHDALIRQNRGSAITDWRALTS